MSPNNLDRIENIITMYPRGLNIREIAQKISVSRLTAARYLDVMAAEGRLELRVLGKSKIYYRPRNIPDLSLIRHMPQILVIVDNSFRIVAFSEAFSAITGLSTEKIVNMPIFDLNSALIHQIIPLLDSSVIETVITKVTFTHAGKTLYYEVNVTPVEIAEASQGWKIVIRDITPGQFAETGLAGSRNIYRALIEQIGETLISFDQDGIITTNRQIRPMTDGYVDNELVNRNIHDFLVTDPDEMSLPPTVPADFYRALPNNKPISCRFRIKDGGIKKHNAIISRVDDGMSAQYFCLLWDAQEVTCANRPV
jgi:PAS domain S-box-containing protein